MSPVPVERLRPARDAMSFPLSPRRSKRRRVARGDTDVRDECEPPPEEDPATPTAPLPLPSPGGEMAELYKDNAIHTAMVRANIKGEGRTRKAAEQY